MQQTCGGRLLVRIRLVNHVWEYRGQLIGAVHVEHVLFLSHGQLLELRVAHMWTNTDRNHTDA